ncbi:hypothetical protein [Zoogloea sp.]|jgi:hypothetical protein|uniref:hypothetical protein n=1 Tax=Zoogloea sp. TaxID=49181 RepID=UPI0037D998A7
MATQKLRKRGLIQSAGLGRYAMTDAGRAWLDSGKRISSGQGIKKVRPTSGLRQRAWWVIARDRTFTVDSLLYTIATGDERNAEDNLRRYISALEHTGFITRLPARAGTAAAWSVVPDRIGRKAPTYRRQLKQVVCGKTGAIYTIGDQHHG